MNAHPEGVAVALSFFVINYWIMKKTKEKYKYIILVRHGEPNNPKKIVYNLDEVMKKEDINHITVDGKKQLRALGKVINQKKFRVVRIRYSNQIRAVESALEINKALKVKDAKVEPRLRDVYAPGGYLERMTMDELKRQPGNIYNRSRWRKYHHETPESIIKRFDDVFQETKNNLKSDETAILLSHGDPIAWWINFKVMNKLPDSKQLRNLIYPVQGQGLMVVLDSENKIIKHYYLKDPELLLGKSY